MGASPNKKAKIRARIASEKRDKAKRRQQRNMNLVIAEDARVARYFARRSSYSDAHDELRRMAKDMKCEHLLPEHIQGGS